MLYDWMFAKYFYFIHFYHSLNYHMSTAVTFYQLAAPLMLFNTGEVYANGAVFLTYIMNLMQFIYIYS